MPSSQPARARRLLAIHERAYKRPHATETKAGRASGADDRGAAAIALACRQGPRDGRAHRPARRYHRGATALPPRRKGDRMKRGATRGMGRVYRRPESRVWWISYYVDGAERRESAKTTVHGEAVAL